MLPWFKADTDQIIDGMLDYEWSSPTPYYLASIEWQAIVAAGRADKWSHPRLAKRWNRPVCWVRRLREQVGSQANRRQIADASQDDSRYIADTSQDNSRDDAGKSQGRSSSGAASGASSSRSIADESQMNRRLIAGTTQADSRDDAGSRARILDPRDLRDLEESVDKDREQEQGSPLPPKGGPVSVENQPVIDVPSPKDPNPGFGSPATLRDQDLVPAPIPVLPKILASLASRPDAKMWKTVWEGLKASHKPVILEIVNVWDAYRTIFPDRRVLDKQGASKIAEALLLGYSLEDLALVPTGAAKSSYHMGQNDQGKRYVDVVTLYRDAKAIDDHIRRAKPLDSPARAKLPAETRNAFGGRQEAIDWHSELGQGRRM